MRFQASLALENWLLSFLVLLYMTARLPVIIDVEHLFAPSPEIRFLYEVGLFCLKDGFRLLLENFAHVRTLHVLCVLR